MSADVLRALHVPGKPLMLVNAWDAGTAKLVEAAGFPAVATSSLAVAETLGFDDGQAAPVEEMFAAARRIAGAVSVPVTVDAEAGYGLDPADFVDRLLATGAVGCNLEDTDHAIGARRPIAGQAEWLAAVRAAAGDRLVINARVDCFLSPDPDLDDALARARAYREAGADCVYPIFVRAAEAIRALVETGPINVNPLPDGLSIGELASLGVARISTGGGTWRMTQHWLSERLAEINSQL